MQDYNDKFRQNLLDLMARSGLNGRELAAAIDTTPATISRYLTKSRTPDLPLVIRLSQYFGVTVDWLMGLNSDSQSFISDELHDIVTKYVAATPDDRKVVQMILAKYGGDTDDKG